jgi:hypothetical protein
MLAQCLCFIGTATVSSSKSSTVLLTFATDFGNGTIMSKACPIIELNTSTLKNALMFLKTFCYQINLHQATMTAITVIPGSVTAYTINLGIIPRLADQGKMKGIPPRMDTTFMPEQCNGGKHDPTAPNKTKTILPAVRGRRSLAVE